VTPSVSSRKNPLFLGRFLSSTPVFSPLRDSCFGPPRVWFTFFVSWTFPSFFRAWWYPPPVCPPPLVARNALPFEAGRFLLFPRLHPFPRKMALESWNWFGKGLFHSFWSLSRTEWPFFPFLISPCLTVFILSTFSLFLRILDLSSRWKIGSISFDDPFALHLVSCWELLLPPPFEVQKRLQFSPGTSATQTPPPFFPFPRFSASGAIPLGGCMFLVGAIYPLTFFRQFLIKPPFDSAGNIFPKKGPDHSRRAPDPDCTLLSCSTLFSPLPHFISIYVVLPRTGPSFPFFRPY